MNTTHLDGSPNSSNQHYQSSFAQSNQKAVGANILRANHITTAPFQKHNNNNNNSIWKTSTRSKSTLLAINIMLLQQQHSQVVSPSFAIRSKWKRDKHERFALTRFPLFGALAVTCTVAIASAAGNKLQLGASALAPKTSNFFHFATVWCMENWWLELEWFFAITHKDGHHRWPLERLSVAR